MPDPRDVADFMGEELVELPVVDEPPKSGVFVDPDDTPLTDEEIAEGDRLGQTIDVDDDEDAG